MKSFIHFYEIIEIISMRNDSGDIVITIQMPHQNISELELYYKDELSIYR